MTTSTPPSAPAGRATGRPAWLTNRRIVALVLLVLGIILIAENSAEVKIRLIVPVVKMPLWVAFLILFAGGLLTGWLLTRQRRAGTSQGSS